MATPGAVRAGTNISNAFRKALPKLPDTNAATLADVIDEETGLRELLAAAKAVWAELDNRYDVDQPAGEAPKEYPFPGAGLLMNQLKMAIERAEKGLSSRTP